MLEKMLLVLQGVIDIDGQVNGHEGRVLGDFKHFQNQARQGEIRVNYLNAAGESIVKFHLIHNRIACYFPCSGLVIRVEDAIRLWHVLKDNTLRRDR